MLCPRARFPFCALYLYQIEDADVFSVLAFAGYLHVPVSPWSSPFLKRLKRGTFLVTKLMLKLLCCSFLTVGT